MELNNTKVEEYINNKKEFIRECQRQHTKAMEDLAEECGNLADIKLNSKEYDILINTVKSLEINRKMLRDTEEDLRRLLCFLDNTKKKECSEDKVIVECYGMQKTYETREQAKEFYTECFHNSEGAERDRYIRILSDIEEGRVFCSDREIR